MSLIPDAKTNRFGIVRQEIPLGRVPRLAAIGMVVAILAGMSPAQAESPAHDLKIRAVQLDLARQKESLDFIRSFIDFSSKYGYNTLVLYLEGRIKTKSFPYLAADDSYTPEQMREVVGYAKEKEMEVIPVVSALGHTDMFLRFPQLHKLAELDGHLDGRFGKDYCMVCPSRKETADFFARYLAEVAEIFPSQYFHAGFDESFDLGMCPECRRRVERDGKSDFLFAEHITTIHNILKRQGKTMLMWDDMFELYPQALEHIPRDIVMCTWCYEPSIALPLAHFLHQAREDVFRKYDRLGFQYLFCPWEVCTANSASLTRYARKHKPLGGLMTTWEKSESSLLSHYPSLAFTGRLWSDREQDADTEKVLEQAIGELAGRDKTTVDSLKTYYLLRPAWYGITSGYCRGEVTQREEEQARVERLVYDTLRSKTAEDNSVVRNVRCNLRERLWLFDVRRHLADLAAGRATGGKQPAQCRALLEELGGIRDERLREWRTTRAGISSENLVGSFSARGKGLEKCFSDLASVDYFLTVRFFLPDPTVSAKTKVIAKDAKGNSCVLAEGVFKPPFLDAAYYDFVFPCKTVPASVRLEVTGHGGQGMCFLQVDGKGKTFEPIAISAVEGNVSSPGHLLTNDLRWAYLGEGYIKDAFVVNDARRIAHVVEVRLGNTDR